MYNSDLQQFPVMSWTSVPCETQQDD